MEKRRRHSDLIMKIHGKVMEFYIKATEQTLLLSLSNFICPRSSATFLQLLSLPLFLLYFRTLFVLLPCILSAFLPQPSSLPAALSACLSLARSPSVLSSWNNESVPGSCAVTGRSMIPAPTGRDGRARERERNGRRRKMRIKTCS